MNHLLQKSRSKIYALFAGLGTIALTVTLVLINSPIRPFFGKAQADYSYRLTLDQSNRITSNVTTTQTFNRYTKKNNPIQFAYTSCNTNNNFHAVINAGGSITNTQPLNGVISLTPSFTTLSGELRIRASYDGEVWGESAALSSGVSFNFGSELYPNYIELSASGESVSLTSVDYYYECQESTQTVKYYREVSSASSDYSGEYLIVDKVSSKGLLPVNGNSNTFDVSFVNGKIVRNETTQANAITFAKSDSKYTLRNSSGKYLDYSTSQSNPTLFWDSEYKSEVAFNNGLFDITSSSKHLIYESNNSRFNYYSSSLSSGERLISLYKYDEGTPIPDYDCGIQCSDSRASKYALGEVFANFVGQKGLNVYAIKSDGSVSKLANNEFSYEIKNGQETISATTPFATTGTFTVNISYNNVFTYSYNIVVNNQAPASDDYVLVTDAADLQVGQNVVITTLSTTSMKALSITQNSNNRAATSVSLEDDVLVINDQVCEFVLEEGTVDGSFAFFDETNNGYIYAASSGSNYLRTESTLDANGSFAIDIDSNDGKAEIVAQGTNSHNILQYNSGSTLFSCYGTASQQAVAIYAKGSGSVPVLVQSVELNTHETTISEGGNVTLSATVLPVDASNKELTWSTSNPSVATVDNDGKVTGVNAGTAVITATAKDGTGYNDSCTVTVETIPVTGVSIAESLALKVGQQSTLSPVITPTNASDKTVTWVSSDPTVASINNGTVTALKAGTTTITVRTVDGGFTDTCTVSVSNVDVTGFDITETSLDIYVGDPDVQLTTVITPADATDKTVTWSTSDSSVATVSNGLVHAVAEGTATITGTCNNISDTVEIHVYPAEEKPVIEYVDLEFLAGSNSYACTVNGHDAIKVGTSSKGGTFRLSVPAKTTKLTLYAAAWNGVSGLSLNISGATASPSSLELDSDSGIANNSPFTLSGNEDSYKFEITLSNINSQTELTFATSAEKRAVSWRAVATVTSSGSTTPVPVESVSVAPNTKTLNIGETATLTATVLPQDADNKEVSWSSNNETIVTVDSTGKITGVAAGTATITAASKEDSSIKGTATITVTNPVVAVTSVQLSVSSKTLVLDGEKTFTLTATVSPSNATNKNVNWSSSNSSVASVSGGTVTGIAVGTTTITATSVSNPDKSANCVVTVKDTEGGDTPAASGWVNSLSVGDTVIMVDENKGNQLNGISTTSTKYGIGTTFSGDTPDVSVYPLTVCAGSTAGSFAFKTSDNTYLYWNSGNSLDTTNSVINKSSWIVSFNGDGVATVSNVGTTNRVIRWNTGSPRFACYSTDTGTHIRFYGAAPAAPVHLSSISIPSTASLSIAKTMTLDVTYNQGFNVEEERGVTWNSSSPSVATVDSTTGLITGVASGTTTITATSTYNTNLKSSCTLTVTEQQLDKWTIMIYMCGADLETEDGQASGDIKEILKVSNQPDDINIIIETGGAKSWSLGSSYIGNATSIPSDKLTRWHVENKKIYKDAELSNAGMGTTNTYKSFLHWGLTEYPATKTGVILWNHGGGLDGVCFDENYSDNPLLNSEMKSAHSSEIGSNKLEWIGYDACLMQNMEIAEFNAPYFNYQVASQESEAGTGWYYTGWVDNLYNNNQTTVLLTEIVDQFIIDQGTSSNQTLSYLNLANISTFKTAMENYASALKSQFSSASVSGSTFASWAKSHIKNYSDEGFCGYGQFDIVDWVNKCQAQTSYKVDASYATALKNAVASLVGYSRKGSSAGNSNGICLTYRCASQVDYSSSETGFSNWRSFNSSYHY